MITEDQLEQLTINWYKEIGWGYAYGPDTATKGDARPNGPIDYHNVALNARLSKAMARINPHLP